MPYLARFKKMLLPALLPVVSYCLLGPLEIFYGNATEFSFGLGDFLLPLCLAAAAVWLGGAALLALLRGRAFDLARPLLVAFGLASYLQNMFLNTRLSEGDGSALRWDTLGSWPLVDGILWMVIFAAVFALWHFLKSERDLISAAVPGFLAAIQVVAVVSLFFTRLPDMSGDLQMSGEKQFQVAQKENIIVFVLDTFSNDHLANAYWLYPDMLDGFEDFTRYDNANCDYYNTYPSMTHMFTGTEYNFAAESQLAWQAEAWSTDRAVKFYDTMQKAGYSCRLYSPSVAYTYGKAENLYGKFDNIQSSPRKVDKGMLLMRLEKMSAFRYLPYLLKPGFEVLTKDFDGVVKLLDTREAIESNTDFYEQLLEQSLTVDKSADKAFIIEHLFGTHGPYTTRPDGTWVEEMGPDQAACGCFTILREYLAQLQSLGLYDSSTIIITADHGNFEYGGYQPIYFIKQAGEKHEAMQTNSAPIRHSDFQATILTLAGQNYDGFDTSIFDWQPGQSRVRSVYRPLKDEAYPLLQNRDSSNVYYRYEYDGDGEVLRTVVDEKGPAEVVCELEPF